MRRFIRASVIGFAGSLLLPASAYAATGPSIVPSWLPYAAGLLSLTVAAVLLTEILRLRRLAFGGAVSSNVSFVVAAVVCLAASALAYWTSNFLPSVTQEQAVLASNLLVAAAMGLLGLYFAGVRRMLLRFVRDLTDSIDDVDIDCEPGQSEPGRHTTQTLAGGSLGG